MNIAKEITSAMSQVDLLNRLLPSIPELNEILTKIRDKYLIPEVLPENEQLVETLFQERTLEEWEAIRQEIENELRVWIQPSFSGLDKIVRLFMELINSSDVTKAFLMDTTVGISEPEAVKFVDGITKNALSGVELLNQIYVRGSEQLLDHLITGRPIKLPLEWFEIVGTLSIPPDGGKFVIAVAHQLSDPDEIAEKFRAKIIETFGEKPKVKKEHLETSEYLAMKNTGKELEDIVDIYLERHPKEISSELEPEEYEIERKKVKDKLKHRINRFPGKGKRVLWF